MVTLLTMLPLSVNGMGVRENATVLLLAPLGVPEATGLTLALSWFAVFLATSLAGGLVYLLHKHQRPVPETARCDDLEADHGSLSGSANQGRARKHRSAA
jgi:hypothetical protein